MEKQERKKKKEKKKRKIITVISRLQGASGYNYEAECPILFHEPTRGNHVIQNTVKKQGEGLEKMKVNGPERQKSGQWRNSWQQVKHARLYSDLLPPNFKGRRFVSSGGIGGLNFCIRSTPLWEPSHKHNMYPEKQVYSSHEKRNAETFVSA